MEAEQFNERLAPGEEVVWVGAPNRDRLLRSIDYVYVWTGVLLGVVATAAFVAAVIAMFDASNGGAVVVGLFVAAVLGASSIYLVFGRFIGRFRKIRKVSYALTSTRVIKRTGPATLEDAPAFEEARLTPSMYTNLSTYYEGRGTITAGSLRLENIDQAPVVFELLQAQLAQLN